MLYKRADKSDEALISFVDKFREMFATMQANVMLFDDKMVKSLTIKYPLNSRETIIMRKHFICLSSFDAPNIILRDVY